MVTASTPGRPVATVPSGRRSSLALSVLIAGWLVPGAGHMLLGKWIRGAILFGAILGMYLIGLALVGKIYAPNTGELLDMLGFVGQLGMGFLYILAHFFGWGATSAVNVYNDWGSKYLVACGLLNIIAAVDAHSLATGRKAS